MLSKIMADPTARILAPVAPATSFSEVYSRLMFVHGHGYPLYHPGPDQSRSLANRRAGIRIGDVGVMTRDGSFDFLFNIFAEHSDVNGRGLPENFEVIGSTIDISITDYFPVDTHLLGNGITRENLLVAYFMTLAGIHDHNFAMPVGPSVILVRQHRERSSNCLKVPPSLKHEIPMLSVALLLCTRRIGTNIWL